jgi:purine nucleoside permease
MKTHPRIAAALLLALSAVAAHAQPAKEQVAVNARCEKEVREYVEALKFIRESAGPQFRDQHMSGYVSEDSVRKVQGEQGSCAAAQLIRDREKTARRG